MGNKKGTQIKLLKAFKEHINKHGFTGLNPYRLSIMVNMKHDVVQRSYNGMDNLTAAYVVSEDYWNELFKRYTMPEDSTEQEVRQMFVDILQANFDKLFDHKGMQAVLWRQASEKSALMRKISEAREKHGAPFLALTDKFFAGKDTDFRTLVMYVLGGTYYIMNHASNNKSTIVGRDINRPDHKKLAREMIEKVIKWAWII